MKMRERDPGLLDYIIDHYNPGDDTDTMRRYLYRAHHNDLLQVRDELNPLFDEISIVAGDILERRKELEEAKGFDRSLTLEEALKSEEIHYDTLVLLMESATNEELERIIETEKGMIADEAADILRARSSEERKSQEDDAEGDGPEEGEEDVED